MILNNTEYVLKGHPDRITDGIAETIAMAIFNVDGLEGRSAVEALYVGNNFVVGGEFKTSLSDKAFSKLVDWIALKILSKQTKETIKVHHMWQKQSPEIYEGSISGWGDNTIAYGFCSASGKNITDAHEKLVQLGEQITLQHSKELPDGKLIIFDDKTTISIEEGISEEGLSKLGVTNPTIFKKSGANVDSGVVGRKLIAERHGNGVAHGGGAFAGKDLTKGDKTMKLIADEIARDIWGKTQEKTLVQVSTKFGSDSIYIQVQNKKLGNKTFKGKTAIEYWNNFIDLYNKYSPVKPSQYLNTKDIKELETLLIKLSKKDKLENHLW